MKICPVGAELFHADGQTDMTELMLFAMCEIRYHANDRIVTQ
jgi:hypothetical protein